MNRGLGEAPKNYIIVDRSEGDANSGEANTAIRDTALAEARALLDTLGDKVDRILTIAGVEDNPIRVQVDGNKITLYCSFQNSLDGYVYEIDSRTISSILGEILTEIDPEQDTAPLLHDALALVMLVRQLLRTPH